MKIKPLLIILGFTLVLSGCVGVIERPTVYVKSRPTVIIEPTAEIVIVHGRPVKRIIVSPRPRPRSVIVHRH